LLAEEQDADGDQGQQHDNDLPTKFFQVAVTRQITPSLEV
jgi:hypothetical protein